MRKLKPGERLVWIQRKWGVQPTAMAQMVKEIGGRGIHVSITEKGKRALLEEYKRQIELIYSDCKVLMVRTGAKKAR